MASGSESSDEFYDALDDSIVGRSSIDGEGGRTAGSGGGNASKRRTMVRSEANHSAVHETASTDHHAASYTESLHSVHQGRFHTTGQLDSTPDSTSKRSPLKPTAKGLSGSVASATFADKQFKEPKSLRSQRFHELRQSMQNDEDENPGNILTPDSQNSSVEGMYVSTGRSNYPFRVIESDVASIHSISSLGIVGRIMAGGSIDASAHSAGSSNMKQMQATGKQQTNKKGSSGSAQKDTGSENDFD
uniref:Uncharacterized protein n=1 Tax=Anopheles maculatus TaxID=74869 RepID=A0A182S639_9DIPT